MKQRPPQSPWTDPRARLGSRRRRLWWTGVLSILVLGLLLAGQGQALVLGNYPATPKSFQVYGKAVHIGASLMSSTIDYRFNDTLKPSSYAQVPLAEQMPADAVIVGAYLFWGGRALDSGMDQTAQFVLADGFAINVSADTCDQVTDPSAISSSVGTHFYCRKDVTSLIASHPGGSFYNGSYSVGDVQAKTASVFLNGQDGINCGTKPGNTNLPETACCNYINPALPGYDPGCQASHASWSLIIIYDTKFSESTLRDVFLYDGFLLLDERGGPGNGSLGQKTFTISNFLVGDPPEALLSYHALEGDKQLGNPEQDPDPLNPTVSKNPDSPACATCYDFVQFNGTKLTGGAENSEPNNIMNSAPPGGSNPGIDLDQFNVSNLLKTGDTSATFLVSSGNGSLADNDTAVQSAGAGELFFFGASVLSINRKSPSFKSPVNKYVANASEASPGDEITYTWDMLNTGPVDAENVAAKLDQFPPPGTDYVAGSTTLNGKPVPDVGATSAILSGLKVGTLTSNTGGNQSATVTFKVKVKAVPGVSEIDSFGISSYTYISGKYPGSYNTQTSVVKLVPPSIQTPILTVSPAKVSPAGTATWTLSIQNATAVVQTLATWTMDLPPEVLFASATGPGTNKSAAAGGSNGTGQARFDNVSVPANGTVTFTITAKLKDLATLQAMGINPIAGHLVAAQASVVVGTKTIKSDDPGQPGTDNPTAFAVQVLSDFTTSTKTYADLSPATPLLPGDQIQFTITLKNTGAGPGTLSVTDPLPGGLTFVSSQSPELSFANGTVSGSNITVAVGATKVLQFTAQLNKDIAPGSSFANIATVSPTDGNPPTVVQTPAIKVEGGPDLSTSQKTAVDINGGALEPGDTIQYTLTLTNTGKLASAALQVSDPVDKGLEAVAAIDNGGVLDAATSAILWSIPALAPGQAIKLNFQAKVKAGVANGTTIANTATITSTNLIVPVVISANLKVQAQPVVSLFTETVTSSAGGSFNPGDTVTYTISLQNTGKGVVGNAVLTTTADGVITGLSASGGGVVNGQTVTWNLGTLSNGDPVKVVTWTGKLAGVVPQGKLVSNQASLAGDGLGSAALSDDPAQPGKQDPTTFSVTAAPNLTTSKKAYLDSNGGQVQGGDSLVFTVTVANTGNAPASQVVVSDVLAPQLTQVQVQGGSFDAASKTVTWNALPSLAPTDKPVDLTFTAIVDKTTLSGTIVSNTAKLAFTETPKTATTNTVSFGVQNLPDFGASTKAVQASLIQSGDKVTYTITVVNSGNSAGTSIVVTDKVPGELDNIVVSGGSYDAGSGTATWTLPTLAAGAQQTVQLSALVKKPLDKGTHVCNQANIVAKENATPSPTNPPGTAPKPGGTATCFDVDSAVKLILTKDVYNIASGAQINQSTVKPKTGLRYFVKASNAGNSVAKQLVVTDIVPVGLENITPLDGGTYDAGTKTITWPTVATLGTLPADQVQFRFEATTLTALDNGLAIANQAQANYQGAPTPQKSDDPTTAAQSDPTILTTVSNIDFSKASLTVSGGQGGGVVKPGDALTYTLTLSNDGDGIGKNVLVSLPIDNRLQYISADGGGTQQGNLLQWQLGTVSPGQATVLHVQVKVKTPQIDAAQISAQGLIQAQGFAAPVLTDSNLQTPVKEPTTVTVSAKPNLSASSWTYLDLNGGAIEPADVIDFALTLRNTGDAMAQALAVKALLQSQTLTDVKAFDSGIAATDSVQWTVPVVSLSPQGDVTLHLQGKIALGLSDGTKVVVIAQIPGVAVPPQLTLTVSAKPKFDTSTLIADDESGWVAKVGQVAPGHTVRIELTLQNTGKAAADGLQLTVPLPGKWSNLSAVTPGATISAGQVQFALGSLAAGGSEKVILKAQVASGALDGDKLPVTATLTATQLATPVPLTGPTLLVVQKPILKVTKTFKDLTGKHLFPTDALQFDITVANIGNAPAQNLAISDAVATSITNLTALGGGTVQGQNASWTIPALQPGQTVTVSLQGKIAAGIQNGATILNQAKAKASQGDEAASNTLTVPVNYPTLAVVTKLVPESPATAPVHPGDTVQLQVFVSADNAQAASNVAVVVPVDPTLFDITALGGSQWDAKAHLLKWSAKDTGSLQAIPGGGAVALQASLKVKATAANGSQAQAQAIAREGETDLAYPSNTATLAIAAIPDLQITKTVTDLSGGHFAPLATVRYQLEVRVKGATAAQQVSVTDALPSGLDLVAVGNNGTAQGSQIQWSTAKTPELQIVLPGQAVVLTFDARIKATANDGDLIANQAFGSADAMVAPAPSDDPKTAAAQDPTVLKVRTSSVLEASVKTAKDDNGGALLPGDTITWKINVIATAGQPVTGVKLIDPVPSGSDYVAGSTTVNGTPVPDNAGQSPLISGLSVAGPGQASGVLAAGADKAAVVTFQTRVRGDAPDGSLVRNLATALADAAPPTPIGPVELVVGKGASIRQTIKTAQVLDTNGNGQADPGEQIQYSITVKNTGKTDATAVSIDDPMPDHGKYVPSSMTLDGLALTDATDGDGASVDAAHKQIHVELGNLAPGQSRSVGLRVQIVVGPLVVNQAIAHAKGLSDEPSDWNGDDGDGNQPTVVQVGTLVPVLQVQKTVQDENGGDVKAGDYLRYTLMVSNLGGAAATGAFVSDPMPRGLLAPGLLAANGGPGPDLLVPAGALIGLVGQNKDIPGTLTVSNLTVGPGETVTVSLRAQVAPNLAAGSSLCNGAHADGGGSVGDAKPICVTVGAMIGEAAVVGTVFEDVGLADGAFQAGQDLPFAHFEVRILPPEGGQDQHQNDLPHQDREM